MPENKTTAGSFKITKRMLWVDVNKSPVPEFRRANMVRKLNVIMLGHS